MKSIHQQCLDVFKELELGSGVYDLKIKNIPAWWFIRFRFYEKLHDFLALKEKKEFYYNNKTLSIIGFFKKNYKSFFLFLLRGIFGILLITFYRQKNKILFFTYPVCKREWKGDKKVDLLLETVFKEIPDELVIVEQMSFGKSFFDWRQKIIFFDGIMIIAFLKNIFNIFHSFEIENWKKFEDKCRKVGFENTCSEWVIKTIKDLIYLNKNKILMQINAAQIIINKLDPKAIVETASYNSGTMALNYIAKKNLIPIIEIQHGFFDELSLGYTYYLRNLKDNILPDKILAYGDFFKESILKNGNAFFSEKIKIVGNLRISEFIKENQSKKTEIRRKIRKKLGISNNFLIVFTSDMYSSDLIIKFLRKAMPLLKNNVKICIKLHPADEEIAEKKKYQKINNIKVLTDNDLDLYQLLISSDLHVGTYSTVIFECLALNVPNIIINIDNRFDSLGLEMNYFNKLIKTRNPLDFSIKVNKFINDEEFKNKYIKEFRALSDRFFNTKEDTPKMIIKEINLLINK